MREVREEKYYLWRGEEVLKADLHAKRCCSFPSRSSAAESEAPRGCRQPPIEKVEDTQQPPGVTWRKNGVER